MYQLETPSQIYDTIIPMCRISATIINQIVKIKCYNIFYRQYFDTSPQSVNILTHHGNNLSISTYFFVNN